MAAQLTLQQAQRVIGTILRDLEKSTGQFVERIEIQSLDTTQLDDTAPRLLRSVHIGLRPIPASHWDV